jgi:hypothetical protein
LAARKRTENKATTGKDEIDKKSKEAKCCGHDCNPSIQEEESGGLRVQGQPGLLRNTLF